MSNINDELRHYHSEKKRITQLFGSETDLFQSVENVLEESSAKESELQKMKEENVNLAENVAVQLRWDPNQGQFKNWWVDFSYFILQSNI